MHRDIVIIGGGPSGMMAAIAAKESRPELSVLLIDGNKRLGTKMRLSGGGRCNLTANVSEKDVVKNVAKNGPFLYSSLHRFGPQEIMDFFEANHCPLKEEDHHRMFPLSDKSKDVVETLERKMKDLAVEVLLETRVQEVLSQKQSLKTDSGSFSYDRLIIATGGVSFSQTGSDGFGHQIAETMGHSIHEFKPAEVPLLSNDEFIQKKTLQGLSFQDLVLKIPQQKVELQHDLLFTHFGLSGPLALRASTYVLECLEDTSACELVIDFLPNKSYDQVMLMIKKDQEIPLPKRLLNYLKSISVNDEFFLQNIKAFKMNVHGSRGWKHAFLTNGGVDTDEINPKTMASKLDERIYFCGEVLDYHAFTGGYNMTCAFSTGFTAGYFAALNCTS